MWYTSRASSDAQLCHFIGRLCRIRPTEMHAPRRALTYAFLVLTSRYDQLFQVTDIQLMHKWTEHATDRNARVGCSPTLRHEREQLVTLELDHLSRKACGNTQMGNFQPTIANQGLSKDGKEGGLYETSCVRCSIHLWLHSCFSSDGVRVSTAAAY